MMLRALFLLPILSLFACRNDGAPEIVLHTSMGDVRVKLLNSTPEHRDYLLSSIDLWRDDSLEFYRVERDFGIQFGPWPTDSLAHDVAVPAEIKALPLGGTLAAVAAENGKWSDGTDFFIILDRPQTDASLDALEKNLNRKFSERERRLYKKCGGLPQLQGQVTVFGEVIQGLEVAQRIAAVPRDAAGRPLARIPVQIGVDH